MDLLLHKQLSFALFVGNKLKFLVLFIPKNIFITYFVKLTKLSTFKNSRSEQTEKRVITRVDGNQISLNEPLKYKHLGESYNVKDKKFEMRAEVGLLTKSIKIQGFIAIYFS